MPLYGYVRVSTLDQDLTVQETALRAAGCEVVRTEKRSGTTREGPPSWPHSSSSCTPATRLW